MDDGKILVVSTPTREPSAMIQAALSGDKGYKIVIVPSREEAVKLTEERLVPNNFHQGPFGVPYEPMGLTCPCCGSNDTSGAKTARLAVICWSCKALFKTIGDGSVHMVECSCGRHDDGKIIKQETREEAREL